MNGSNAVVNSLKFKLFDDYYNICFKTWRTTLLVTISASNWKKGVCTCPAFFKERMCKHVIGCAARNKLVKIPNEAKDNAMERKRGRGRPAKARKALEFQPPDQPEARAGTKRKATGAIVEAQTSKKSKSSTASESTSASVSTSASSSAPSTLQAKKKRSKA